MENSEEARVCRLFLYKQRERVSVKPPNIKIALDKTNEEKNRTKEVLERSKQIFNESLGYDIEGYIPEGKKTPTRYFLTRKNEYEDSTPIPFNDNEKENFGLLCYLFFIITFSPGGAATYDLIDDRFKMANLTESINDQGGLKDLIKKWITQEYIIENKSENSSESKYTFGPRFEVEIGKERLDNVIESLI